MSSNSQAGQHAQRKINPCRANVAHQINLCPANVVHLQMTRPDSSLDFQVKSSNPCKLFPRRLTGVRASEAGGLPARLFHDVYHASYKDSKLIERLSCVVPRLITGIKTDVHLGYFCLWARHHTVEHDPFIRSELVSRIQLSDLTCCKFGHLTLRNLAPTKTS